MAEDAETGVPRPKSTGKRPLEVGGAGEGDHVAVVVAGAGARGAYEAGALSIILPVLEEMEQRPTVFVGTSAGLSNAALFASLAHLPAKQAAIQALDLWGSVKQSQLFSPAVPSLLAAVPQYAARLFVLGHGMTSLL